MEMLFRLLVVTITQALFLGGFAFIILDRLQWYMEKLGFKPSWSFDVKMKKGNPKDIGYLFSGIITCVLANVNVFRQKRFVTQVSFHTTKHLVACMGGLHDAITFSPPIPKSLGADFAERIRKQVASTIIGEFIEAHCRIESMLPYGGDDGGPVGYSYFISYADGEMGEGGMQTIPCSFKPCILDMGFTSVGALQSEINLEKLQYPVAEMGPFLSIMSGKAKGVLMKMRPEQGVEAE